MDQQSLFNTAPQPWQLDDHDDWLAARVAFAEAPFGPYDYSIPAELEGSIKPGIRVEVPLGRGNRKMAGYCIEIIGAFSDNASSVNPGRLKPISRAIDKSPLLSGTLLELAKWISNYYLCPIGTVIETIVPPGIRNDAGTREMLFLSLPEDIASRMKTEKLSQLQTKILANAWPQCRGLDAARVGRHGGLHRWSDFDVAKTRPDRRHCETRPAEDARDSRRRTHGGPAAESGTANGTESDY